MRPESMDLRMIVDLAFDSAGDVRMIERADYPNYTSCLTTKLCRNRAGREQSSG
jgi:hypothetical protein